VILPSQKWKSRNFTAELFVINRSITLELEQQSFLRALKIGKKIYLRNVTSEFRKQCIGAYCLKIMNFTDRTNFMDILHFHETLWKVSNNFMGREIHSTHTGFS
jgi:hypothetical protein